MGNPVSKILLVEDEQNLGATLSEYLSSLGHQVTWGKDIKTGREFFLKQTPDIVLMDIGLPDGSGLTLARELRDIRKDFVLLFLSALNDPDTKVEGLEIGADDYITKPFALKELTMRLSRIIQFRNDSLAQKDIIIGKLSIRFKQYEVVDATGALIQLSQKECEILKLLYNNAGKVTSRDDIINTIWGADQYPSNRTVDNYIVKLRKWSETDHARSLQIISVRGIGYKLVLNGESNGII